MDGEKTGGSVPGRALRKRERVPETARNAVRSRSWRYRSALRYVLPYPLKILNYVGLRAAIAKRKADHRFYPVKLGVEVTSRCNLMCPLCPRSAEAAGRDTGDMEWSSYTGLIDTLAPFLFQVRLHGLGEPTLHSRLPEMVRYAHRKGIYTNFHTNGHFLDRHTTDALLASGLDEINVAIDGMSEETYRSYRRGGNLERVRTGIERMCSARRELGRGTPRINLQFLVMSQNEHEIGELYSFASRTGVERVFLKSLNIAWGKESGNRAYLPANPAYSRYRTDGAEIELIDPQPCSRVFTESIVNWDGSVGICANDHPGSGRVKGNFFTDKPRDILFGADYVRAREVSLKRGFDTCRLCMEARSPV